MNGRAASPAPSSPAAPAHGWPRELSPARVPAERAAGLAPAGPAGGAADSERSRASSEEAEGLSGGAGRCWREIGRSEACAVAAEQSGEAAASSAAAAQPWPPTGTRPAPEPGRGLPAEKAGGRGCAWPPAWSRGEISSAPTPCRGEAAQ